MKRYLYGWTLVIHIHRIFCKRFVCGQINLHNCQCVMTQDCSLYIISVKCLKYLKKSLNNMTVYKGIIKSIWQPYLMWSIPHKYCGLKKSTVRQKLMFHSTITRHEKKTFHRVDVRNLTQLDCKMVWRYYLVWLKCEVKNVE